MAGFGVQFPYKRPVSGMDERQELAELSLMTFPF
jgi:hypothetical protein